MSLRNAYLSGLTALLTSVFAANLQAQDTGPLLPHVGGRIATSFSNTFGPDAESELVFTSITPATQSLKYVSGRGVQVARDIRVQDIQSSSVYVLGYSPKMAQMLPGTTSLGISGASLEELRTKGRTPLSLIYDENGARLDGELVLLDKEAKLTISIEDQNVVTPAVLAKGTFGAQPKQAVGEFFFLANKNNPMMLQSQIQFSWEKQPRYERVTRVTAGGSMQSAMQQSLNTMRRYDIQGILFETGSAKLRPEAAALTADIAVTLKNNPSWKLMINGHTDSIGGADANLKLSSERAASVKADLVRQGIDAARLQTTGLGESKPKADNTTLEGRALNRRVELVRTDN